ncbi:HD domain-containing protein [bacterium]|nr:HD domain-containing protein [bacterium]
MKIFNDPIHNFISLEKEPFVRIIDTRIFQRLRNIHQLGLCSFVFPGAVHSRFLHSIGATWLMKIAIDNLREKGVEVSNEERTASMTAILLHDVGHGPFSHVLEGTIIKGLHHETMTVKLINKIQKETNLDLSLTLKIFEGSYPKHFLHELISSQLDVDRLDYLKRDSFFTGVPSGDIGVNRILKNLNVYKNHLVVEAKGLYDIENYVVARYLMYWQVYYHKTVLSADILLKSIFERVRDLFIESPKIKIQGSESLLYFLKNNAKHYTDFDSETLIEKFLQIDDTELLTTIKLWVNSKDKILSDLASRFCERRFFKTRQIPTTKIIDSDSLKKAIFKYLPKEIPHETKNLKYYFNSIESKSKAYSYFASETNTPIKIIFPNKTIKEFADAVDTGYIKALTQEVNKNFICYLKEANPEINKLFD